MPDNISIQHKRSAVAGKIPTPAQLAVGEIALNFTDKSIYTKDVSGNILELSRDVIKRSVAPSTPAAGDLWYDTINNKINLFTSGSWQTVATSAGGTGTVTSIMTGTGLLGGPITTAGTISINTAASLTWTGSANWTGSSVLSANNSYFNTSSIIRLQANNSSGSSGQVLYTNGNSIYWADSLKSNWTVAGTDIVRNSKVGVGSSVAPLSTLDVTGSAVQNVITLGSSGTLSMDILQSQVFKTTLTGNATFQFVNTVGTKCLTVILEITNGGAFLVTWPNIKWPGGSTGAPALTTSGVDIVTFITTDGGATWRGELFTKDSK